MQQRYTCKKQLTWSTYTPVNIASQVEQGAMSHFQVAAIMLCMIINMMDGFDVLVIAFTAPSIAAEWGLSASMVGVLLSSGLLGMVLGSLLLGPWADRIGRRPLILICLLVITIGMLLSGFCQNAQQLIAMRMLTGLGIGGILPGLNTIVAEYSSLRWRSLSVSLMQTGYPVGATLGGILTAILIANYGWRSAFFMGSLASAAMIPLVWKQLPESLDYLLSRRPEGALERVNLLLHRLGKLTVATLPELSERQTRQSQGYAALLSDPLLRHRSILLGTAFFIMMLTFYFVMSWTPKILVDSGLSTQQGISGGIVLNLGGIVGSVLLGYLSSRLSLIRLTTIYMLVGGLLMVVFSQATSSIGFMTLIASGVGFFLFGSMIGLYALAPALFPTDSRAAGISMAMGVGRIGGIASPLLAGWLFEFGLPQHTAYILFAVPLLIAATAVLLLGRLRQQP